MPDPPFGCPIPSPALFNRIGEHFRAAVGAFAIGNEVPVVRFGKHDREADVMRPYLARAAATGRSQVAAIGISQEFQSWAAVLLGGAVGLWIGFDLIYALQDIDSDRATGGARGHGRAATGAPNRVFTGP